MYKTSVKRPHTFFFTRIVVSFWVLGTSTGGWNIQWFYQTTTSKNVDKIGLHVHVVIYRVIPTLDMEGFRFLVSKSWYCINYKSWLFSWCIFGIYMQNSAPKLFSERVLCAHWKGVVFIVFDISKPFCRHNCDIVCHAELQVAINHTYSHLFIYFGLIYNNYIQQLFLSMWVKIGDTVHIADKALP